jgi:hypothetical protein
MMPHAVPPAWRPSQAAGRAVVAVGVDRQLRQAVGWVARYGVEDIAEGECHGGCGEDRDQREDGCEVAAHATFSRLAAGSP